MVGTAIVLVILIVVVTIATKSLIKDKKNGKSIQCGCDCSSCGGHCSSHAPVKEAKKRG